MKKQELKNSAEFGKKIACIINPSAANKKWKRRKSLRRYIQENIPGPIIDSQADKAQTLQMTERLCRENDIIVVAGGDGTIADVMQGIIKSQYQEKVTLGIVPMGSGNALCRSLGIPLNIKKAIRLIREGETKIIDLLEIEGETTAAFGSIGASAEVTHEKLKKNIPGLWGHIYASKIIPKMRLKNEEVELIDGVDDSGNPFDHLTINLKVLDCVVSKSKHFGYGWRAAPKAELDDGYVDIVFLEISGFKYMLLFPFIFFGILQRKQRHFKVKKALFKGKSLMMQYHGEIWGIRDRIEVKVLPRILRIIVPKK
jgi:diacylglycerol kinase (ATP)